MDGLEDKAEVSIAARRDRRRCAILLTKKSLLRMAVKEFHIQWKS